MALHYGFLLPLTAAASALGARLLRQINFATHLEKLVFATAIVTYSRVEAMVGDTVELE